MAAFDAEQENPQSGADPNATGSPNAVAGAGTPILVGASEPGSYFADPALDGLVDRTPPGTVIDPKEAELLLPNIIRPGEHVAPGEFIQLLPYRPSREQSDPGVAIYQYGTGESDKQRAHASLILGFSAKAPDDPAFVFKAARQFNTIPQAIAAGPDDFARRMAMQDANKALRGAPALQRNIIQNPALAELMHDDVGNAAALEKSMRAPPSMTAYDPSFGQRVTEGIRNFFGLPERERARAANGLAAREAGITVAQARDAIGGMSEAPEQAASKFLHILSWGLIPDMAGDAQTTAGVVAGGAGNVAGFATSPVKAAESLIKKFGPEALKLTGRESAGAALAKDAARNALTFGTANTLANTGNALDSASVGDVIKSEAKAAASGAVTGATIGAISRALPNNTVAQAGARILGLNAATDAEHGKVPFQDFAEWDKLTSAQKVQALFDHGLDTLFAFRGAGSPSGGVLYDAGRARLAEQDHQNLAASSAIAAKSVWRGRDPESFKNMVRSVPGGDRSLHIDAQTLREKMDETGVSPDALGETLPHVAGQLEKGGQAEGHVSIPLPDYLTHLAGTPLGDAVLPHLKADPEAMSHAEAQAFHGNLADALARADGENAEAGLAEAANAVDDPAAGTQPAPQKADTEQGVEPAQAADAPATTETEAPKAPENDEVLAPSPGARAPGGGLDAHEAAEGHLLAKHVGKTEQELADRYVKEPKIPGSSSFFSQTHAEEAAAAIIKANEEKIASWLATSKASKLVVTATMNAPVGLHVAPGATNATNVSGVRLVLIRNAKSPLGYTIRTGFPE